MKTERKYQIYGIPRKRYDASYYGVTREDAIDEQCGGIVWAASPEAALEDFIAEEHGEDPFIRSEYEYAVCEYFAYFAELIEDDEEDEEEEDTDD